MEGSKLPEGKLKQLHVLSTDFFHLRLILPEEIWVFVTEKLLKKSPTDFERLANSSPFFRKLLASKRTVNLFENVFDLVASSVYKMEGLEGLPISEVFKCRRVCSKWSNAVDKLIPEKFQHFGQRKCNNQLAKVGRAFENILENNWFTNHIDSTNEKTVQRFIHHFEYTHPPADQPKSRNPLIWGDLSVIIMTPNDNEVEYERYENYMDGISILLLNFGSHLHKFSLDIDRHINFVDDLVLQDWFSYMPNIHTLTFEGDNWVDFVDGAFHFQASYSLPKLEQLHTLEIKGLPDTVFLQLIRANTHISTLILTWWYEEYRFYMIPLPNLKKLEIEFDSSEIFENLEDERVQWPLESLNLAFHQGDDDHDFVGFADMFRMIENKFGTTLVSLDLNLYMEIEETKVALYEECKNGRLCLPNLKNIELSLCDVLVCLDFLLAMKENLEEISVHVRYKYPVAKEDADSSGTTVEFIGFEDKMLESNIWAFFDKLKKVEVSAHWVGAEYCQSKLYFREDWMRKLESN